MTARRARRGGLAPRAVRALLALGFAVGGLVTSASPASPPELSADQRRRLAAGEVVVRDSMPPGASASARGGTALAIVRASPEQVWRVLIDYPGHPRYYPRVVAAQVVQSDERHAVVRYWVGIGPVSFSFHMDKFLDPQRRRIDWHLADGHGHGLFRENSGYWQVDEAERAALVTYAIAVRTVLPGFLTGSSERESLVETMTAMRKLVEEGGGAAPKP
ncbi:MAG TPA: SRPBCC family protein [Candidatus Acidoferrum sp.]|jgi:ribosome-associated toxin RatA of RatAB toxin-antitoxin module|nr:SRPBCC family protein [Candidatus Acidoferrum sp.]